MHANRREFLAVCSAGCLAAACQGRADEPAANQRLERQVGITLSSFSGHLSARPAPGKITLLELPRVLREQLDMRVIDLNTSGFASFEPALLERIRQAADDAGCLLTNLKMNQGQLDMSSSDEAMRRAALDAYRRSIDAAAMLGLRWARPLPLKHRPDMAIHVASYQQLADYAADRKVQMLVENFGWMQGDAGSVAELVKQIGRNVAACPDTGNWDSQQLRRDGLAKSFPLAVTCDFKARQLDEQGGHAAYDLKECFQIGWDAGFRGPWCLEHAHPDRQRLFRDLALLRDQLRRWMT